MHRFAMRGSALEGFTVESIIDLAGPGDDPDACLFFATATE